MKYPIYSKLIAVILFLFILSVEPSMYKTPWVVSILIKEAGIL